MANLNHKARALMAKVVKHHAVQSIHSEAEYGDLEFDGIWGDKPIPPDHGPGDWWVSLKNGYTFEDCTSVHESSLKHVLLQLESVVFSKPE